MGDYSEIIQQIFHAFPMYHKIGTAAYKEGLENIEALMTITGHPEKKLKCIHIAGSNGKGSVAHLLSSYFQESGCKTGLFTSPHLVNFRERIKINGAMIEEEEVILFFQQYQEQFNQLEPSFFEMTTALAFHYFAKQNVDIAIIEVGLGGRLDATNVITPLLSVITNISLEHTQFLGNTLPKIAAEKAGIIKPSVPVVIGEYLPDTYPIFENIAGQKKAPIFLADHHYCVNQLTQHNQYQTISITDEHHNVLYPEIKLPLAGNYQLKNIATFFQAIQIMKDIIPQKEDKVAAAIENVIENTHFMGRWQVIQKEPLTICDAGHNTGGLQLTMQQLAAIQCQQLYIIIGFVRDKDIDHIIPLLPKKAYYYICTPQIERGLETDTLCKKIKDAGLVYFPLYTVSNALAEVKRKAGKEDVVFIGGSCFIVGEALQHL